MDTTETKDAHPGGVDCTQARRLIGAFAHGGLEARAARVLRAHVGACDDCRLYYRQSLEAVGRLGAGRRRAAEQPVDEAAERRARIVRLSAQVARPNRRRSTLKVVLVTAGMVLAFTVLSQTIRVPPALELYWSGGQVHVDDTIVVFERESMDVRRGHWLWTDERGKARLVARSGRLELGPNTALLVEDTEEPRVLLRRGDVRPEGRWTIATPLGVVNCESGAGRVRLSAGSLTVESRGGVLEVVGPLGARRVGPADAALELGPGGVVAAGPEPEAGQP